MGNVCTLSRHGPTAAHDWMHDPSRDVLVQIDSYYNGDPTKQMVNACINHSMLSMLGLNTACGQCMDSLYMWSMHGPNKAYGQCMDSLYMWSMHGPNKAYGQCMDQSQHVVNAQCMVQIDFKFSTHTNLDLQTLLQMQYTVHCTAYTTHCTVYS